MSSTPAPNAPQLWIVLRAYLRQTCALFGDPADIARALFLTREQHRHLCEWLRPLEALARRLLYLMACALPRPTAPALKERKTRAPRMMKAGFGAAFDVDNSERWRVSSFNVLERRRPKQRAQASAQAILSAQPQAVSGADDDRIPATALAIRMEALIRVASDPAPYAAKLALEITDQEEPPLELTIVPRQHTGPLYEPARQASALICAAAFAPCADTS